MKKFSFFLIISLLGILSSCSPKTAEKAISSVKHAEWSKNAVIYEVNVRQFSKEGTFKAFETQLPRLKELGVDILWFMPIYPIGEIDRKGTLGSYYSIKDYKSINPEFGSMDDFRDVVNEAHRLGMKVIIDWVANHTSRDAKWISTNPEWYVIDSTTKKPVTPFDWTDVAKLDYSNAGMRAAMLEAMRFWVDEAKIDGFRCDVAAEVPVDFWDNAVAELKKSSPDLFMLAEADKPELQMKAFDMYYSWNLFKLMNDMAKGKANTDSLRSYIKNELNRFPENTIPMNFTSNHDENSWNGTEFERLGVQAGQMAALTFILPGMPLIYNGQESGFNRRLQFFEKDSIDWQPESSFNLLYKSLCALKKANPALNSPLTSKMSELITDKPDKVLALKYSTGNNTLIAIFNFSGEALSVTISDKIKKGIYEEFMANVSKKIKKETIFELTPFGYRIFYKN